MKFSFFFLFFSFCFLNAFGDEIQSLRQENKDLKERIELLERSFQELKNKLEPQKSPEPETPLKSLLQQENKELLERIDRLEKQSSPLNMKFLKGKLDITLYGYIKADVIYDSARINNGNIAYFVESEERIDQEDDQLNLTANQTRFGFDIKAPLWEGIETTGKIEMDFYGGGGENTPHLRFRHAYIKVHWKKSDFSILAGQTFDLVAPLNPDTINFMVLCSSGNIGYRRPQIRLSKGWEIGKNSKLSLDAAFTRTVGNTNLLYPEYLDAGEDSGFPTIQGRAGICLPLWMEKSASFGISGHWGQEEYDLDNQGKNKDFDSWSLALDITLPLYENIALRGEIWIGKNLGSYLGGVQQTVNKTRLKEISSQGGWLALEIGPISKWKYNLGFGMDDPDDEDLSPGMRSKNWSIYGNTYYSLTEYCTIGGEISYWRTSYESQKKGDSIRLHGTMILNF